MTKKEFLRRLAVHGAMLDRWPIEIQASAKARLAADPALKQAFDDHAALDRLLAHATESAPSADLAGRILANAATTPQDAREPNTDQGLVADILQPRRLWPAIACLTASAVIGFVFGLQGIGVVTGEAVDLSGLMFGFDTWSL